MLQRPGQRDDARAHPRSVAILHLGELGLPVTLDDQPNRLVGAKPSGQSRTRAAFVSQQESGGCGSWVTPGLPPWDPSTNCGPIASPLRAESAGESVVLPRLSDERPQGGQHCGRAQEGPRPREHCPCSDREHLGKLQRVGDVCERARGDQARRRVERHGRTSAARGVFGQRREADDPGQAEQLQDQAANPWGVVVPRGQRTVADGDEEPRQVPSQQQDVSECVKNVASDQAAPLGRPVGEQLGGQGHQREQQPTTRGRCLGPGNVPIGEAPDDEVDDEQRGHPRWCWPPSERDGR